jgi:hypothetical protein
MLLSRSHTGTTLGRKKQTRLELTTRAETKKEMAQPRMALSVRIAEMNLRSARIPEHANSRIPGKAEKIIPSPRKSQLEKAQIAIDVPEKHRYRDLLIDNELVDEQGSDVNLKKRARVEITMASRAASPRK